MSAMSMATLSEEESVGSGVPESMRCDACNAIAYQLRQGLVSAENKISGKRLSEIIVVDALEAVCAGRLQPKTLGTGDNYRTVEQDWGAPRSASVWGVAQDLMARFLTFWRLVWVY